MQDDIDAFDRFKYTLEWLMAVQERNPEALQFGLIHVCFHSKEALGSAYGAREAVNMLRELARQLGQAFRKTDLIARNTTDFWILVPYTNPATVTEKVSKLVELASDNGLDIVDRDVAVFNIPDPKITNNKAFDTAAELLAYLKANRAIAVHWDPVCQPT
jgi:hypothetical protein